MRGSLEATGRKTIIDPLRDSGYRDRRIQRETGLDLPALELSLTAISSQRKCSLQVRQTGMTDLPIWN